MIDHLDNLLRELFVSEIDEIRDGAMQVRFQPPDEDWKTFVGSLSVAGTPDNALNIYLFDIRENRKLRSNERVQHFENGFAQVTHAPRRVDCHYLITAWSPATETPSVEATLDEHQLLYKAVDALTRHESLVPSEVYPPGGLPADFPVSIADAELPTMLLPIEGFPKYAEFWGTMGNKHPWRPAIWLVVTLPVIAPPHPGGPMVTTRIANLGSQDRPGMSETLLQIGGHVFDSAKSPPVPVVGAWVRLLTTDDKPLQIAETDAAGRFTFSDLRSDGPAKGKYRLRYQAVGFGEKVRDVKVPSPSGEYDLQF